MALVTTSSDSDGVDLVGSATQPSATGQQVLRTVDLDLEIGRVAEIEIILDCTNVAHNNTRVRVQIDIGGNWRTIENFTITVGTQTEAIHIGPFKTVNDFRITLDSPTAATYLVPYRIIATRLK